VNDARRTGVTRELARFIVDSRWSSIPTEISHEPGARYSIGRAVQSAAAGWAAVGDGPRAHRADGYTKCRSAQRPQRQHTRLRRHAFANGASSDDPVAAAVIALAEHSRATGDAIVARLHTWWRRVHAGNAISPEHYNAGCHIVATCGIFGAAAACAKLLDLDAKSTAWVFGIAPSQAASTTGARQHDEVVGHGERGAQQPHGCTTGRQRLYEQPAASAASRACLRNGVTSMRSYAAWARHGAPLTGLEAKPFVQHCAAAAPIYGQVGVHESTETCVNDRAVVVLRARAMLVEDSKMPKEPAGITTHVSGGSTFDKYVPRAAGSLDRPVTMKHLAENSTRSQSGDGRNATHARSSSHHGRGRVRALGGATLEPERRDAVRRFEWSSAVLRRSWQGNAHCRAAIRVRSERQSG
jgi:MmgE/PrpD N-terminal domain/MmgE/PrpD C-terminal domain